MVDTVSAEVAKGRGSDDAIMLYTSGTTGLPKAVTFSHRQLVLHTLAVGLAMGQQPYEQGTLSRPCHPLLQIESIAA